MADLELTRSRDNGRSYTLEGVGALRLQGLFSRSVVAGPVAATGA